MSWATFGTKIKIDESTYNKAVAGAQSMGAGYHKNVKIIALEQLIGDKAIIGKDGNEIKAFRITYENGEGQTKVQTIFPVGKNFETGEPMLSYGYNRFTHAIAGSVSEGYKLIQAVEDTDGAALNGLIGAVVSINIGLPKKGFTVKVAENSAYFVQDIQTGEDFEDGKVFNSMEEALEYAKEQGIRLKFNTVLGVSPASEEFAENNANVISSAINNQNSAEKPTVQAVNSARF